MRQYSLRATYSIPSHPRTQRCLFLLLTLLLTLSAPTAGALTSESTTVSQVQAAHVHVSLISEHNTLKHGSALSLGVLMKPEEGWHLYWKNAGDSGAAPKFLWALSSNGSAPIHASPQFHWPFPERIPFGPLLNYGYSEEVLFVAEFPPETLAQAAPGVSQGTTVTVDLEWLVCKEECIPGNAVLELSLPHTQSDSIVDPRWRDVFARTRALWPITDSTITTSAHFEPVQNDRGEYVIRFRVPEFVRQKFDESPASLEVAFFPDEGDIIENAAPQRLHFDGDLHALFLVRDRINDAISPRLSGILVSNLGWTTPGLAQALAVDMSVQGVPAAPADAPASSPQGAATTPSSDLTLAFAMLFAFLGGLILNIMPCVFPVLSLKLLSFTQEAGHGYRHTLRQGLLFSLGVLLCFWVLAATLLLLRATGQGLGWGFQLQTPEFVMALAFLMTALALNLLGTFEFGARIQRSFGTVKTGEGPIGAIGSGMLVVILATPCTAPFMGSALAYALTVSGLEGFLVFTALGVGMALPYFVLCAIPSLTRLLPRPGQWMVTFKQLMAFPLFATVIWLLSVISDQSNGAATIGSLIGLLVFAFGLWVVGTWGAPHRRRFSRISARIICVLLTLLGAWVCFSAITNAQSVARTLPSGEYVDPYGQRWEKFSKERLSELRTEGRTIFVDFTASWCITCQVNKRLVFSSSAVRDAFAARNIALLRADWTNRDDSITQALAEYGRQGVPLNLLFVPDGSGASTKNPFIFPALLSPGIVLDALP